MSLLKQLGLTRALAVGFGVLLLAPTVLEAQRSPGLGPRGPSSGPALLESVLEHADRMGLTPDQLASLEELQALSEERTTAATERIEAWRTELPAVREAMESIRSDRRETMRELRATLTVEQMQVLRRSSAGLGRSLGRSGARFGAGGRDRLHGPRGRSGRQPAFRRLRGVGGGWLWAPRGP